MIDSRLTSARFGKVAIYAIMLVVAVSMFIPFVELLARSLSFPTEVATGKVTLWPRNVTLGNYTYFKDYTMLWRSLFNTILVTVVGTLWSLLITALMAFPLARPRSEFPAGPVIILLVIFTMIFNPPMVPFYLVMRELGLLNGLFRSLVLTHSVQPFYLILMIVYFRDFEEELFDASRMDGASDLTILLRVVLPLSKPILTTLAVYYAVSYWNIFQTALVLISKQSLKTLQVFVQQMLTESIDAAERTIGVYNPFRYSESTKAALTLISTIPIVMVYPFLQKYFIKGSRLGAIKG